MSAIKRCISILLVLCLCLSLLPTTALAAEADRAMGSAGVIDSMSGQESIMPMDRTDPPSAFGIDVSHHQGTIDWDTVASQIDFAIIRCGYGDNVTSQDDRQWVSNVEACTRLGIPFGVYIYSYALSEAEAISEAEHVLRLVEGYHPTLPIYFDLEDSSILNACSTTQILNITRTFCNKIEAAGYRAGVYANHDWWTNYLTSSEYDQWDRWIARYASAPGYSKDYTIWQYTSSGTISGISGNVDLNYWYGTFPPQTDECGCSTSYAGNYTCTTTSANLLIRSGHGTSFGIVGRIPSGATVYVSMASGTGAGHWAHVEYNGITGFASMEYLELQDSSGEVDAKISQWISHEAMGDSISSAKVGDWVYLCYRMYDANSGDALNVAVPDRTYTVTETIYNPDGTVCHTYTYDNSDSNWIGIRCLTAGTYTYEIIIDGDWSGTVSDSFVVEPNPMEVRASASEIGLTLGSDESEVIYVWSTGYNANSTYFSWGKSNDNVSCSWGDEVDGRYPLTISANSAGSTTITLSVHDSESTAVLDTCTVNVTVTANTYTITYNANGGSGAPASQTKTQGTSLTLSSTVPTRFGYNFQGWATSASATSASYQPGDSFTTNANTTLYAVWAAPNEMSGNYGEYTRNPTIAYADQGVYYKFIPNASTYYRFYATGDTDNKIYLYDANGTQLATDDDSGGNRQFKLEYSCTANTTYYVYVRLYSSSATGSVPFTVSKRYTISYNANGGTGAPGEQYKYYGFDLVLSSTVPTRAGYTFQGWATSSTATTAEYQPGDTYTQSGSNRTLYAVWSQNQYTISYNANGGSGAPSSQMKSGGTALTLSATVPTRFGYTFLGWSTSSTATSATYLPGGSFTTDANTTLYAVWQSAATISSGVTNSSYSAAISFANGSKYYSFTPSFTGKIQLESTGTSDTRVYVYDTGGNQLGYNDDSGTDNNFLLTQSVTSGTQYYIMVRHYSSGTGTINFTVKRAYDVTYNANGGSGAPSAQVKVYGTSLALSSTVPTRSGYTFLGWATSSTAAAATYQAGGSFSTNANTTLYAVWSENCDNGHSYRYTVTKTPTTSATGTLTGTCSKCSATNSVTLPKLNTTDYTYSVTRAATCTAAGTGRYTWKTTTYGSFYFDVSIAATGHSYTAVVTAPTCTEQGYTTHTCGCGDSYVDSHTEALGHDWVNGICSRCGAADPDYGSVASGWSGNLVWELDRNGILTFSGSGKMKNYASKSEMPWYSYRDQIKTVVLENGVTSIGDYAFYGMPELESIEIASTVTTIGDYAFKNAPKLDHVILPERLTSLGESAFYACTGLISIEIPAKLYTIKAYTFKNCTNLTSVTLNEGNLQKISDGAFYGTGLRSLVLPDCLDILDTYSFKGCTKLEYIELGSGLTELREAVFYGTAISTIEIPEGITRIGPYAFKNCTSLTGIALPSTLTSVGEASFYACTALESLELPDSVTMIGNYAFRKCASLLDVSLGSGLVNIGESSFYGCEALVYLNVPANVTTIQSYAFKGCTDLEIVVLPNALATLGDSAFHTCTSLDEITIPAGVTKIGEYCFSGSTGIDDFYFLGNAPTIGTGAFNKITATAYYPTGNSTWTASVRQNYGGTITWTAA